MVTILAILIVIGMLIWLSTKVITLLEEISQNINGSSSKNHEIQMQITEKISKIDAAQENIRSLSSSVAKLQAVLTDKKSRGSFGEAQLQQLVNNLIPPKLALMQQTLSNGCRPDCIIKLPAPTNPIVIDAKFPLENFKLMTSKNHKDPEYITYKRLFKKDLKTHIDNIADKYIIPPETANSAIMFIPAEAIFAEIHGYNPDIVDYAHSRKVWLASPTTLMAILTTASAVIKDNATIENLDQVKNQLLALGREFERFNTRMHSLFKHIESCNQDANKIQISTEKIMKRFQQIQEFES